MRKNKRYGFRLEIILLCIAGPFFVADNIVYARLSQSIWDRLPMEMSAVLPWLAMTAAYLLVFRSAIGLFLWLKRRMTVKISNQIKERIYKRYVESKESVYTKKSILSTLNNDIPQLETEYYQAILSFITCIAEVILAFAVTFSKNIYYGAFCFIFMMIPVLLTRKRVAAIENLNRELQKDREDYTKFMSTVSPGKDSIRNYQMFDVLLGMHGGLASQLAGVNTKKREQLSKNTIFNQNTNRCASGVAALVGFYLASKGILTLGWVVAFIQLSSSMTYTLVEGISEWTKFSSIRSMKKDIFKKYDVHVKSCGVDVETSAVEEIPVFEAMGLSCHIKHCQLGKKTVLENIDFELEPGEKLLISGGNGSGKTTLMKILLGLNKDFEGTVAWRDLDGNPVNLPESGIAYVPQFPFLFDDTVKDNIILDNPPDDERLGEILSQVHISMEPSKPVNNIRQNVSGGEKQKVELARAVYSKRPVMILDEPYSALDHKSAVDVEQLVLSDPEKTVITISHSVPEENRKLYGRRLVLEGGRQISYI